ncbi:hypothetical protein Dimus_009957 [Dionaea muscipula]
MESETDDQRSLETIERLMGSLTEFLAMAKPFLTTSRPDSDRSEENNAVMVALTLYIINKASVGSGDDENSSPREELEWFLNSLSKALVPKLIEYFFFFKAGRDLRFHLQFWFTNVGLFHVSAAQERAFRAAVLDGDILGYFYLPEYVNEQEATKDPLAGRVMLLTANLLDFRGSWLEKFDASDRIVNDFYVNHGEIVKSTLYDQQEFTVY